MARFQFVHLFARACTGFASSQSTATGAVAQSLDAAIQWLRGRARAHPQLQLQVLVTGSLYLVGDVLRLLGKAPK
jgi:folylpolyglutamate synthase